MNVCLVLVHLFVLFPVYNTLLVCWQAVKPHYPEAHRSKTVPQFEQDGKYKSLKKKAFFLKQKNPCRRVRTHAQTRHVSQPLLCKPPFWKRPRINRHLSMWARTGNEKTWLQELAAAAPVLTFLRFILNYISSEVKMLWRGAGFPQPSWFFLSQEMDLEDVVVGGQRWACETRGIRADLHFPLGSGSASPSRPVASGCEVDAGICVVRCRTGPNLPHSVWRTYYRSEQTVWTTYSRARPCRGLAERGLELACKTLLKLDSIYHFWPFCHV